MRLTLSSAFVVAACASCSGTPAPVATIDVGSPQPPASAPRPRVAAAPDASGDPRLDRQAALREAAEFGMIGFVDDSDAGPPPPQAAPPSVPGPDLAPAAIQSVVRAAVKPMRRCYERIGLARDAKLTGRVTTRFQIGVDGKVTLVPGSGSDPGMAEVAECVRKVFSTLLFPARGSGKPVTVVYPLVFSPSD